ncbi:MAG: succinate dehydrogenase, cytochrome b556 subunit [Phyllobacteriaceae bacterium]|nr:succinate dehydrogenase, cytochrome b556 subunit [Phyllobacteriaceae bacterium]
MSTSSAARDRSDRPLSPHLQIYKFTPTMAASILHRFTGAALYFGTLILAWWISAAAISPAYFDWVTGVLVSIPGRLILLGYTWALMQHMLGGIRHFIWDSGALMDKANATKLALASFAGSAVLTVLIWIAAYAMRG